MFLLLRFRIRTVMIVVAVAGVVSAASASSDHFRFVFGELLPGTLLSLSLVYTIFLACHRAPLAGADDRETGEL